MPKQEHMEQKKEQCVKKPGELYFLALIFIIMLLVFIEALEHPGIFPWDPKGPGFIAQIMSLIIMIITILIAIDIIRKDYKEGKISEVVQYLITKQVAAIIIIILIYALLLETLHFELSTLLLLVGTMIFLDRKKPITKIIVSVGTLLFILVVFQTIFQIILP